MTHRSLRISICESEHCLRELMCKGERWLCRGLCCCAGKKTPLARKGGAGRTERLRRTPDFPVPDFFSLTHIHTYTHEINHFNHFKVYNSLAFSTCKLLNIFIIPKGNPIPTNSHSSFPVPPSLRQPLIYFLSVWIFLFWTFYINGVIRYVTFHVWLVLLGIIISRFIHVVTCISVSLLL